MYITHIQTIKNTYLYIYIYIYIYLVYNYKKLEVYEKYEVQFHQKFTLKFQTAVLSKNFFKNKSNNKARKSGYYLTLQSIYFKPKIHPQQ